MADSGGLSAQKRRLALEQLSRDRLLAITDRYELDVGDRRVVANHVDAIVRARRVDFGEVLGGLSREELKAICEALKLDTGGREKQVLIDRILGNEQPTKAKEPGKTRGAKKRRSQPPASRNNNGEAVPDLENGQTLNAAAGIGL